jgi:glycosyltransferase involved in cell wall biosynthesis
MSRARPLRIAYVTGALYTGGAERRMLALAQGLPKDRFEVEFVLLTHAGPAAPLLEAAGARVRVLGWARRRSRLHLLRWIWDVARLGPQLRSGRYDVLDAWLFHAYAVTALVRPVAGAPVMFSGRHFMAEGQPHFGRLERFLDALARRRSDAIVAVGDAVRDDAIAHEHLDPAKMRVIRNGVVIPAPMLQAEREAIRAGWGFGPRNVVVGSVANYKPRKGLDMLIRIAAGLRPEMPELRLVLVGEGTHRPVLEALIAELGVGDIVRLHGRELDARRLYGAFDVFAHASETEGLPNAVIEAAAAALPIVATRAGGTAETVEDGVSGVLVPVDDEAAFSAALRRLAGDRGLRKQLGTAARQRAASIFGMDRMVAEFAALYEEFAARKGIRR